VCIKQPTIQPARRQIDDGPGKGMLVSSGDTFQFQRTNIPEREPMAEEKIQTKHPLGKSGKNISRQKYDTLRGAILSALQKRELTHTELFSQLNKRLTSKFVGNVSWYGETVKLDLEAKKIIERTSSKPQKYRLKKK
jgi:Family of unknown function (DUF6958)